MFQRILSALGALGLVLAIINVAPLAWSDEPGGTALVALGTCLTALRWIVDAIKGEAKE